MYLFIEPNSFIIPINWQRSRDHVVFPHLILLLNFDQLQIHVHGTWNMVHGTWNTPFIIYYEIVQTPLCLRFFRFVLQLNECESIARISGRIFKIPIIRKIIILYPFTMAVTYNMSELIDMENVWSLKVFSASFSFFSEKKKYKQVVWQTRSFRILFRLTN